MAQLQSLWNNGKRRYRNKIQIIQLIYLSVERLWSQWTFSMDIVQLEYWNDLTGQCPLSPWKVSTVSMDIAHGLSGHCPWTQWTISMDSLEIVHGHCPVSFWAPPPLYLGQCIVKECLCSIYNACHFYFMTCNACRYMSINTDRHICPSILIDIYSH